MKRPTKNTNHTTKRTLWRNALLGIIGLTMSACGIGADDEAKQSEEKGPDVVSIQGDNTSAAFTEKEQELEALKRELDALRDKVAKAQAIEPPTVEVPKKAQVKKPSVVTTALEPGKLVSHEVDGELGIVASAVALGVEKRVPLGVGNTFNLDAEKIWAFIKVKNEKEATKLRMVWKRNGKQRMAVDLRVGKSSGWRTWSYKRISKRDAGEWTVDVLTQSGEKLHTMAFKISADSSTTDIAGK